MLFVRRASGLVREMSTGSAAFYNIVCAIGTTPGVVLCGLGSVPLFLMYFGPWVVPGYSIGEGVNALFSTLLLFIFFCLISVMPRSGGDYVFTTRITSPFWGWLEGWGLLWTILAFLGVTVFFFGWALTGTLVIGGVVMGYSSWIPSAQWFSSSTGLMFLSVVVAIVIFLQHMLPPKTYYNSFKWLVGGSLVLTALMIPMFVGATPEKFTAAFEHYSGMTVQQLTDQATSAGWGWSTFSVPSFALITAMALYNYIGYQFSVYFAGELKGNVGRNTAIATYAGLLAPFFCQSILTAILFVLVSYDVMAPWSYLFWIGQAPFYGTIPFTPLMGALLHPELAILGILSGIGTVALGVLILSAWAALISRIVFAWSMDRVIPSWFAKIDPRTRSPLRIVLLCCLGTVFFTWLALYGGNPMSALWFTVLLSVLTWVMPGLNAILLPSRRKDLFELAPSWAKKKVLGVNWLVLAGVIWTVYIAFCYVVSFAVPFISAVETLGLESASAFAISSGIAAFIITTIAGAIIWYISAWYNAKRGIRFKDIFSQIPPE
jgi:amino acid transporter